MPHNVQLATATFVLPRALCTSYVETREWVVDLNVYRNGECQGQAAVDVEDSRKRWKLGRALTGEKAEALYQFYRDRRGPTEPFYFYDVFDSDNRFQWDPIGASEVGRFTVRFEGPYSDQLRLGRARAEFGLIDMVGHPSRGFLVGLCNLLRSWTRPLGVPRPRSVFTPI